MNNRKYHHVFGITTIESIGISVYIYINTYTNENIATKEVENMNGTIFVLSTDIDKDTFRSNQEIGNLDVALYTKKNGWRPKHISIRPLV